MRTVLKSMLLFLFISMPQLINADVTETDTMTREEAISRVMDLSGLNVQVPQIHDIMMETFSSLSAKVPEEYRDELYNLVTLSFDGTKMLETVKAEVENAISLHEATSMLQWYTSEEGMMITAIEESPLDMADQQAMIEEKNSLYENKSRVMLMEKLEAATHAAESQVNMQLDILKSTLKLSQSKATEEEINQYLEKTRKEIEKPTREYIILTYLYTYKSIEEATLRHYLDFLSKTTTQAMIKSSNYGINKAIAQATQKMLDGVLLLDKKAKKQ